ncbi:GGDEF domain-containing protein [Candidatus Contubernalis alkaliaceticus]|uniref:GGDEF domain-containing protein n=1 Tax=Candidatus Contubernalis alkaliaceticus TaxID=338645 RepID=UPI001F4BCED1|nr:GGDEF domain-containing protein [Candidatus Contubernalis alkalaceticus]UNC92854.1 GGDEF domain-containing protein [Candidatus Contubernalis alkalaceticus]
MSNSRIDKPDDSKIPGIDNYQDMMDRIWNHLSSIIGQAATAVVFQNAMQEIQRGSPCLNKIKVDYAGVSLKQLFKQEEPVEETLMLRSLLFYFEGITTVLINLTEDMLIRQVQPLMRDIRINTFSTNLPNRFSLEKALSCQVARANRGIGGALLMISLDNYKPANDNLRSVWGDQLMKELADLLMSRLRKDDFLAWLGADEFALVLNDVSEQDVKIIIGKLRGAVEQHEFTFLEISCKLSLIFQVIMVDGLMDAQQILNKMDNILCSVKKDETNGLLW